MSITRILVGIDGSPSAQRAVEWTAALAARTGASVLAVHAFPTSPSYGQSKMAVPGAVLGKTEEALEEQLRGPWTAPLHDLGERLTVRLVDGHPTHALLDAASDVDADLIVTGNRGLGAFGELLLGSVSQNVVHHAAMPVAVVRGGRDDGPLGLRTFMVGIDGSPDSIRALDWAAELAGQTGAEVVLASIVARDRVPMLDDVALAITRDLKQRLDETASRIRGHAIPCRTEASAGTPARELMALARREGAGLVVVGSRGLGGVRARMLGSVSHQLAHHIDRPLVIVPPRSPEAQEHEPLAAAERESWPQWTGLL